MSAAVVFARIDSARLPGKALADLGGRPMLARVLDRVRRARNIKRLIVATSDRDIDDGIAACAAANGAEAFRGDATDVAGRALACCKASGLDRFVRISGDSPFMPAELIDSCVEAADGADADIVTNVFPRSFPPGASVEVIKVQALREAHPLMNAKEREDVTAHFYAHPERWRIVNVSAAGNRYAGVRLTVDTPSELEWARAMTEQLGPAPETASLDDVVALCRTLRRVA